MNQPVYLYSTNAVRQRIKQIMSSAKGERIVVSAYVGEGADKILGSAKGLHLYCSPEGGSTNPDVVEKLRSAGAMVSFVDHLHAKVYWTADQGVVITSANLSAHSMGPQGLKEAGVWFPDSSSFRIKELLGEIRPIRKYSDRIIGQMRVDSLRKPPPQRLNKKLRTFHDWMQSAKAARFNWATEYIEGETDLSHAARIRANSIEPGVEEEDLDSLTVKRGDYTDNSWILCYAASDDSVKKSSLYWFLVNFSVDISPTEKGIYDSQWPSQVVQIYKHRPPFSIDQPFRSAFADVAAEYGIRNLKARRTKQLSDRFLKKLAQKYSEYS